MELSTHANLADYLPWVKKIAQFVRATFVPWEDIQDLIQDGMVGLLQALKRYDNSRSFKSWAYLRVRGEMLDRSIQRNHGSIISLCPTSFPDSFSEALSQRNTSYIESESCEEFNEALSNAISRLPLREREVIGLTNRMKKNQIAKMLKVDPSLISIRYREAVIHLRESLKDWIEPSSP